MKIVINFSYLKFFNKKKKGCDSNSENNPNNDYPEEISENDDEKNGFSSNEDGEENSRKIHNDDEEKEDLYFEGEQENEFYENFKKKFCNFCCFVFIFLIELKKISQKNF